MKLSCHGSIWRTIRISRPVPRLRDGIATALIGISSIHLLKTFINADKVEQKTILWQVAIHIIFVASAVILAWIDRLIPRLRDGSNATVSKI
jgi:uncharacterized protein (TIGR00645 family)